MPLLYDLPPNAGALRQGEILGDIWIHRPLYPPIENPENTPINIHSPYHKLMIVMSADCDLEQDFNRRFPEPQSQAQYQSVNVDDTHPSLIPDILFCDIYEEADIRPRIAGTDIWKQIRKTQNERYHRFELANVGNPAQRELPTLYLDFKKSLSLDNTFAI